MAADRSGMFDWFWQSPVMRELQSWVDATRALADPVWVLAGILAAALVIVWRLSRPATVRDHDVPGTHFLGNLMPKTLERMSRSPKRKRLRSRKEMEREIGMVREMRRAKERRGKG